MKLVEVIAQCIDHWPSRDVVVVQNSTGELLFVYSVFSPQIRYVDGLWRQVDGVTPIHPARVLCRVEVAEDFSTAKVTEEEWNRYKIASAKPTMGEVMRIRPESTAPDQLSHVGKLVVIVGEDHVDSRCPMVVYRTFDSYSDYGSVPASELDREGVEKEVWISKAMDVLRSTGPARNNWHETLSQIYDVKEAMGFVGEIQDVR